MHGKASNSYLPCPRENWENVKLEVPRYKVTGSAVPFCRITAIDRRSLRSKSEGVKSGQVWVQDVQSFPLLTPVSAVLCPFQRIHQDPAFPFSSKWRGEGEGEKMLIQAPR